MAEINRKSEIPETKAPEASGFREIKPQTDMLISEAKDFVNNLFHSPFKETQDTSDGYYNDYETRKSKTPIDGIRGQWEGERGESKYVPADQTDAGKAANDKLAKKGMDGIEYKNGEPNFSECAEATVVIDYMTEHRNDYYDAEGNYTSGNFSQADVKCAEQWNKSQRDGRTDWKAEDIREWRRENNYSWHERCDTRTMDLVSYDIHSYFSHSGGCAVCRVRDAANIGGDFDE